MKPKNFPERKRQRQEGALARIKSKTAGKPEKEIVPVSNLYAIATLKEAVSKGSRRDVRTKKRRDTTARMFRAA